MNNETVNIQAKKMLAKLLAQENITIVHAGIRTASFDPENRILTLPIWDNMDGDLYDLLVLHEIGHALYSPLDSKSITDACLKIDLKYPRSVRSFLNVVEDARIEKFIKNLYPGGRGAFIRGYKNLIDRDFFGTQNRNINEFGIIDRINIYFKTGDFTINFSDIERNFIVDIEKVLTFDEVAEITSRLYQYAKDERDRKQDNEDESGDTDNPLELEDDEDDDDLTIDPDNNGGDGLPDEKESKKNDNDACIDGLPDEKDDEKNKKDDGDSDETPKEDKKTNNKVKHNGPSEEPVESITDKTWEEKQESLRDKQARSFHYLGIPKPKLDHIIIPYEKVHYSIRKYYMSINKGNVYEHIAEFERFKQENKPVVNWLLKEFEIHKAAEQYTRSQTSKTGILDTHRLDQYKFADDLMKKITTVPGGKNHALEIFVDWSSSMRNHVLGTIHQLINIAMFARKAQIMFNAYTFGALIQKYIDDGPNNEMFEHHTDDFAFWTEFSLRQILSSKMSAEEFNDACVNLLLMGSGVGDSRLCFSYGNLPPTDRMGGTPLNEAIVAALSIVNELRKNTKIQIINTIFITDGDATTDKKYVTRWGGCSFMDYSKENIFLRDSVTHIDYPLSDDTLENTKQFIQVLKSRTDVNVVGFYIISRNDPNIYTILERLYPNKWHQERTEILNQLDKDYYVAVSDKGYTEYYIIPGGDKLKIKSSGSSLNPYMGTGQMVTVLTEDGLKQRKQRIVLTRFIKLIS